MADQDLRGLRVLIANERRDRLGRVAQVVVALGHDVIARETDVKLVGAVTDRLHPDLAIVALGPSPEHALELIGEIVHEASCPVIMLLGSRDPAFVREAAKRGVFAYIVGPTAEDLQGAIDVTLQRFREYHSLQGAFGRRVMIEQAKGILMERYAVGAEKAFAMLREHSQHSGHKLADIAQGVVNAHPLLRTAPPPQEHHDPPHQLEAPQTLERSP